MDDKIYDVAIIGSGPSGLTAAIYTSRGSASTVIFGGESWGGQLMLTTQVDNFPAQLGIMGPDLMSKMKDHATSFGAEFLPISITEIKVDDKPFELIDSNNKTHKAKSIILATGAETLWLDVPNLKNLIGRGISSCAPCDAPFFRDKKVAVVGGGDSAMEEALVLTKYANEVFVIHRRDSFRASKIMQDKVLSNPKIKVIWNTEVVSVRGESKLESLDLVNKLTNQPSQLVVDGLFVAIGHKPMSDVFKGVIDIDEKGFIKVFENSKTNVAGIFVAGDVHDHKYKQAITAAGFGCMAGMDALEYLAN